MWKSAGETFPQQESIAAKGTGPALLGSFRSFEQFTSSKVNVWRGHGTGKIKYPQPSSDNCIAFVELKYICGTNFRIGSIREQTYQRPPLPYRELVQAINRSDIFKPYDAPLIK